MNMRLQNSSQDFPGDLANRIESRSSRSSHIPQSAARGGIRQSTPADVAPQIHNGSHLNFPVLDRQRYSANDPSQPHEHSNMRKIQNVGEYFRAGA